MRLLAALLVPLTLAPQEKVPPGEPPVAVHSFSNPLGRGMLSEWQTWVLDLENKSGKDTELVVRVEQPEARVGVTRREPMSRGARKRLFFYLPLGATGLLESQSRYEIRDADGRRIADGRANDAQAPPGAAAYQIGILTRDPSSANALGLPQQVRSIPVASARLSSAVFPDRAVGLSALDAIVLHESPLDELAPAQARALRDYVRAGGTAILSPGAEARWLSHPVLQALAPLRTTAMETREKLPHLAARFGPFPEPRPFLFHEIEGARELGWKRELLRAESGFGRVLVIPFDVRRPPFTTWAGTEGLWTELLGALPRRFTEPNAPFLPAATWQERQSLYQTMGVLVNPYPSFYLLLAIASAYLVVVGPVNYLVLRKMGMTLLVVVTVPLISAAFLGIIFGIGYVVKGTSTVACSARFLSTRSGLDCAREVQLYTLFSPAARTYDVLVSPDTAALPYRRAVPQDLNYDWRYQRTETEPLECEEGKEFVYRSVGLGQWQSWQAEGRALRDLGGGVRFDVSGETLQVANLSPYAIERGVFLDTGERATCTPFEGVAPGKSVEVPLRPGRRRPTEELGLPRDSFGGRLLAPTLDPFPQGAATPRPRRFLLCLLREDAPPIRAEARFSGGSRSLTLLHVSESESP